MRRGMLAALPAIALAGTIQAANGAETTGRIELHGFVPVICRAEFQSLPATMPGQSVQLGALHEFCNAGSGFQVVMEYAPSHDPGVMLVDGQAVRLNPNGRTVIRRHIGPAIETSFLGYVPGTEPVANFHVTLNSQML